MDSLFLHLMQPSLPSQVSIQFERSSILLPERLQLQGLSNLPSFTGVPLTVTNANDASATQTTQGTPHSPPPPPATVTDPATGAQVPVPSTLVLPRAVVAPTPANVLPALTPENKVGDLIDFLVHNGTCANT